MATQRTRDLVAAGPSVRTLNQAINARRRLQEEGIKLIRVVQAAQKRLAEINDEEELLATIIDAAGHDVESAVTKTPSITLPAATPAKKKASKKKASVKKKTK